MTACGNPIVIEQGAGYRVTSFWNGQSYLIRKEATQEEIYIQDEEAQMWRDEYNELSTDHTQEGTRASRFSWRELLDTMCGPYFTE